MASVNDQAIIDKFARLLRTLITISLRADAEEVKFGHPCSHLIEEAATKGVNNLSAELLVRESSFTHEFRLNGADLKLTWHPYQRGDQQRLKVSIQNNHGDSRYTTTVPRERESRLNND